MIQLLQRNKSNLNIVTKAIHTTYNPYSFSHIANFAPMGRRIQLFVSLSEESAKDSKDFILTITDVNNRIIRLSADQNQKTRLLFSQHLDTSLYEGPFRLELFQNKESDNFQNYTFVICYTQEEEERSTPGFFSRIGKYFPGPANN